MICLWSSGNPFAPLSYLSYGTQVIPDDLAPYDPSTDLIQLGEGFDVVPIPFTVSPLGLLKKIRSIVGKRREWEGLILEPDKWKDVMVRLLSQMQLSSVEVPYRLHAILSCSQSTSPILNIKRQRRTERSLSSSMHTTARSVHSSTIPEYEMGRKLITLFDARLPTEYPFPLLLKSLVGQSLHLALITEHLRSSAVN